VLRLVAPALVASVLVIASAGSGSAATPLISQGDRHGDVHVMNSAADVDPVVVDSVDLRHVTVRRQRDGLRVVVRLERVLPIHTHWFQQVALLVGSYQAPTSLAVVMTPQHVGAAFAYVESVEEEELSEPISCRVTATKGTRTVRLDIPTRCVPHGEVTVGVSALLFDKRNLEDPVVAYDGLPVRGKIDLG
jgi:hypothetical protein